MPLLPTRADGRGGRVEGSARVTTLKKKGGLRRKKRGSLRHARPQKKPAGKETEHERKHLLSAQV